MGGDAGGTTSKGGVKMAKFWGEFGGSALYHASVIFAPWKWWVDLNPIVTVMSTKGPPN